MNTALDKENGFCKQDSGIFVMGRMSSNRRVCSISRHLRGCLLALLIIQGTGQATGCVTSEMAVEHDVSFLLSSNGITPEDVIDNLSDAGPLSDTALLDDDGVLHPIEASALLASGSGQRFLRYAINCALSQGESVINLGHGPSSLPGNLGLAPAWKDRGLTPSEKRAVSACILAHVNAFGEDVAISVRHDDLIGIEPGEMVAYEFYEATFYGDLFAPVPTMYACAGQPAPAATLVTPSDDDRAQRVCSDSASPGSSETLCGFERVGSCSAVCDTSVAGSYHNCWDSPERNGISFPESMSVWLSLDDAPIAP